MINRDEFRSEVLLILCGKIILHSFVVPCFESSVWFLSLLLILNNDSNVSLVLTYLMLNISRFNR